MSTLVVVALIAGIGIGACVLYLVGCWLNYCSWYSLNWLGMKRKKKGQP